jgi:hypothetical protein
VLETDDLDVAFDLLSSNTALQPGVELAAPGNTRVKFRTRVTKGPGAPKGRMTFELLDAAPASVEAVTAWLVRCLQGRLTSVQLGRSAIEVEPDALRRVLTAAVGAG